MLRASYLIAILSVLFMAAGCPSDDDDDTTVEGDDDTEDADTGDDGYIVLVYLDLPDLGNSAFLTGMFYTIVDPGEPGVEYSMPDAQDECALTLYDEGDLDTGAIYDYESAGNLSVRGGEIDITVTPTSSDDVITYDRELDPSEIELGIAYDVAATGDEFPPFDAAAGLAMPELLHLTSPAAGTSFELGGDLDVTWSGGEMESVFLQLTTNDIDSQPARYGMLICEVTNDGQFTIPENQIGQMPPGWSALQLSQSNRVFVDVGGRRISLSGMVASAAMGTNP